MRAGAESSIASLLSRDAKLLYQCCATWPSVPSACLTLHRQCEVKN